MESAAVALIVGVSTVLASGVTSSIVTYRLNRSKDETMFLREKAEQLYLATDEFDKAFSSQALTYFPLLKGEIDFNQMLNMQVEWGSRPTKHGGPETMIMLAEIYFPPVQPALEEVWAKRDAYNKLTSEIKWTWKEYGSVTGGGLLQRFKAVSLDVDRAIEAFKKSIVSAAQTHAGVKR
ncbi:MAG TPA: hypothetical protein VFW19_10365 [Allosphingosinicella sp.]|nr:hypothetical protein [Allosphingosinicella sp.]